MKKIFYVSPCPASRPRVSRWSVYYGKKYTQFREDMKMALNDVQFVPFERLIFADLKFFIQIPKSWSKKKKTSKQGKFCDNNSDNDNHIKSILDSMNGVYYVDDSQIVDIRSRMYWSEDPRIEVELIELGDDC